ncbi:MAG: DUF3788 domain-containing protein [Bacteroidales bacterium]|nr:DUF3788 domain-containing protein [Bacteroidales bacterium]
MDKSIFTDKNTTPSNDDLKESLGDTYQLWQLIKDYIISKYPKGFEEWNYSNFGWNFRIKDKKRAIVYLLPRDKFFKVAFVFGQKATDIIMQSQISQAIKTELSSARVYAEGRGIRIDIKNDSIISDIKSLIDIKMAN